MFDVVLVKHRQFFYATEVLRTRLVTRVPIHYKQTEQSVQRAACVKDADGDGG